MKSHFKSWNNAMCCMSCSYLRSTMVCTVCLAAILGHETMLHCMSCSYLRSTVVCAVCLSMIWGHGTMVCVYVLLRPLVMELCVFLWSFYDANSHFCVSKCFRFLCKQIFLFCASKCLMNIKSIRHLSNGSCLGRRFENGRILERYYIWCFAIFYELCGWGPAL